MTKIMISLILLLLYTFSSADTNIFTYKVVSKQRSAQTDKKIYVNIEVASLQKKSSIAIDLPQNIVATFQYERSMHRNSEDFSWVGKPTDGSIDEFSIITTKDGATYGVIRYQGKEYILQMNKEGEYSISYKKPFIKSGSDERIVPKTLMKSEIPLDNNKLNVTKKKRIENNKPNFRALKRVGNSTVDVMVLYTQAYANNYGNSLGAVIQSSIDYANVAMSNSNIAFTYVLDFYGLYENSSSNESVSINSALNYLTYDDSIKQLRAKEKSDLVTLFRLNLNPQSGSTIGLGWVASSLSRSDMRKYSFNVSEHEAATFAHEAGHNLGCGHDAYQGCNGLYSDSCGYIENKNSANEFGTVMSYTTNPIQYFSNPNINNLATGTPVGSASAYCAKTIIETKEVMSINDNVQEVNEVGDTINGASISGVTDDKDDRDSYLVNLGAATTFTLSSQYSSPAFYVNLYKDGNYLISAFDDSSKSLTLENGEYTIVISNADDSGNSYYVNSKNYEVSFSTNYVQAQSTKPTITPIIMYLIN